METTLLILGVSRRAVLKEGVQVATGGQSEYSSQAAFVERRGLRRARCGSERGAYSERGNKSRTQCRKPPSRSTAQPLSPGTAFVV